MKKLLLLAVISCTMQVSSAKGKTCQGWRDCPEGTRCDTEINMCIEQEPANLDPELKKRFWENFMLLIDGEEQKKQAVINPTK